MYRELTPKGVKVPNDFAISAEAYWYVLQQAGALAPLKAALSGLDPGDVQDLAVRGRRAREIVYAAPLPEDLKREILQAYRTLHRTARARARA